MKRDDFLKEFRETYGDECADEMEEYLDSYPYPIQTNWGTFGKW